ncbi:MAG: PadR family transcriptional regulator [Bacillota bacterium]|nr:PadR family transcriptional regulator [Bacillota bacterium]
MSTVDLMLLGHLMKAPMNAYEMKKNLEFANISRWVKISTPSVYKNLVKLNEKGFLDSKTVKEGEMPEKTVYTINEKGKEYFRKLMQRYSESVGNIYFDFNAVIANLDKVDKDTGLQMLNKLQEQFFILQKIMERNVESKQDIPYIGMSIIKLYEGLFNLLYNWSDDLKKEYSKK